MAETIRIATRGSVLALAQANMVAAQCRASFPLLCFELKVIKTTGDKLQGVSLAKESVNLPKGLFTKELEVALLNGDADMAVHSLKDLPTELPNGLKLGAVGPREDVRDVLIYRDEAHRGFRSGLGVMDLPAGSTVATSSTRRRAQLLERNSGISVVEIRGNVLTRVQKLMARSELSATVLALAGMSRLKFRIGQDGGLEGEGMPAGVLATVLDLEVMLPCVGQGAIGIEMRQDDSRIGAICERLNHDQTMWSVMAERAFLSAMGGGCQSPVAAHAEVKGDMLRMRGVWYMGNVRRGEVIGSVAAAIELGGKLAVQLKG